MKLKGPPLIHTDNGNVKMFQRQDLEKLMQGIGQIVQNNPVSTTISRAKVLYKLNSMIILKQLD